LLTSALNVRFRDVNFIIQALLIVWFYATPIIYTFSFIPHLYIWFWRINPMTSIVQLFQYAFLDADAPGPAMLAMNIFIIICISIIGVKVFRKESKNFDDWV
jgi:lipopolysaccharide transport system permease protein